MVREVLCTLENGKRFGMDRVFNPGPCLLIASRWQDFAAAQYRTVQEGSLKTWLDSPRVESTLLIIIGANAVTPGPGGVFLRFELSETRFQPSWAR